jgi:hypothetical protein
MLNFSACGYTKLAEMSLGASRVSPGLEHHMIAVKGLKANGQSCTGMSDQISVRSAIHSATLGYSSGAILNATIEDSTRVPPIFSGERMQRCYKVTGTAAEFR